MFSPAASAASLADVVQTLGVVGRVLDPLLVATAFGVVVAALIPQGRRLLAPGLGLLVAALALGEAALMWFHLRLYQICQVADPSTGVVTGSFAVPLWVESEKLYVWALILAVIALVLRRHRAELQPLLAVGAAVLTVGAIVWGRPFSAPLPDFLAQYDAYLSAIGSGDFGGAMNAFSSAEGSRRFFYNTWYMWVHPPLLFLSYGAFVASFAATVLMIARRRSSFE
ncbi:MAG TPA: hypothetical protein VLQ52_06020, partial [Coriobacteriia bacterium]|nr:hypothetical protein [Coriobacteriia bacterium]